MEAKGKKIDANPLAKRVSQVFKTFGFHIQDANKANIWDFICHNRDKSKKYAVYCTEDYNKVQSLIKVAIKQSLKERIRLVVVTKKPYEAQNELEAAQTDYCVTNLEHMEKMDNSMIEALQREGFEGEKVLNYNKLDEGKVILK